MIKYAVIENGKVVNTVVAEADYAEAQGWTVCPEEAGIDWDYTNGQFIDNRPKSPEPPPPPAPTKEELFQQLLALQTQIQSLK